MEASSYFFLLSIPVLLVSYYQLITHYFSGQGNYRLNAASGLIGAGISVLSCFLFIPSLGLKGAALSAIAGTLAMCLFYIYRFKVHTSLSTKDLVLFFRHKNVF
jgi:O-antigen/teichoic acid export membrane protein